MINELANAFWQISALYYYGSMGQTVKHEEGEKGWTCLWGVSELSRSLRKIKDVSSLVKEVDSWVEKLDKKYSAGIKLDDADQKKLNKASWKWYEKMLSIARRLDKERIPLELIAERIKDIEKGFEPVLERMQQYMTGIQNASLAFVESSPTERSLEPKLRGLLNTTNSGELMLTGYFDQYLLKVFQTLIPKPAIKFISPELTNSKSDKVNLDALKRLGKIGAEVRVHPMLHARMVLSPTEIIAGSADIKSDCLGGRRYDAAIWSNNPLLVRSGKAFFNKVWVESKPLS